MEELKKNLLLELINLCSAEEIQKIVEMFEGELAVMSYLLSQEEVNSTDISIRFGVSKARVTAIVSSLIKKEFVFLEKSSADKRKSIVKLTLSGKRFIETKLIVLDHWLINFLNNLGYEKSKTFIDLLQEINALLKKGE